MSRENLELVRRSIEEWNRAWSGDAPAANLALYCHPDVEHVPRRSATEGAYRGLAGMEQFIADTREIFEKFELRYQLLDLGERVLAWGEVHVRAKGSGIETDIASAGIYEFRDGKIARWEDFGSKELALDAVGLAE